MTAHANTPSDSPEAADTTAEETAAASATSAASTAVTATTAAQKKGFSFAGALSSEEGIYGLVVVSGVIATSGSAGALLRHTLVFTLVTIAVFWLAHVYAGTVAMHGTRHEQSGTPMTLGSAIRHAINRSHGLFIAALLPAFVLLLGALGLIHRQASVWSALWTAVIVFAVLGYLSYRRRGASIPIRILGAVVTASFGIVIILVKITFAH